MDLGRLYVVTPRDVFPSEPAHFSTWVAANLDRLSEALGLDLELLKLEAEVGSFSLDILARVADTQDLVIIENQIEPTDHRHLGQILTYASGYDAKYVVWISPRFQEEHRAALDWLNVNTVTDRNFFAIQVEVLRIDDSRPAVNFRAIVVPNQWQKTASQIARGTESAGDQEQLNAVYAAVYERARTSGEFAKLRLPPRRYSVYELEFTHQSIVYYAIALGRNTVRAEVILRHSGPSINVRPFDLLKEQANAIQEGVHGDISWDFKPDRKIQALRINNAIDRANLANQIDVVAFWAADRLIELHRVLEPVLDIEIPKAIADTRAAVDAPDSDAML
jgi:Domain of unknown function (DUF4268)